MKGDREKCLQGGSVGLYCKAGKHQQLLSLFRVWLYR